MLTPTTGTQVGFHTVPPGQAQVPDHIEPDAMRSRRFWRRWLNWLRALLRWLLAPWSGISDLVRQISQLETDMAGHVSTLQRLQTALDYDALTGAHSRLYFLAAVRQNIARYARDEHALAGKGFTIGILDVDRFKQLNDLHGHLCGDQALLGIAEQAARLLRREGDVFARFGGDEFVFLLPQTPLQGAHVLAEKLRAAVAALRLPVGGQSLTVSIGLASCPSHGLTAEALLHAADCALYRAKVHRDAVRIAGEL